MCDSRFYDYAWVGTFFLLGESAAGYAFLVMKYRRKLDRITHLSNAHFGLMLCLSCAPALEELSHEAGSGGVPGVENKPEDGKKGTGGEGSQTVGGGGGRNEGGGGSGRNVGGSGGREQDVNGSGGRNESRSGGQGPGGGGSGGAEAPDPTSGGAPNGAGGWIIDAGPYPELIGDELEPKDCAAVAKLAVGLEPLEDDFVMYIHNNKTRVSQLPLVETGTYDFTVSWGDGTTDRVTASDDPKSGHVYTDNKAGHWVRLRGTIVGWSYRESHLPQSPFRLSALNTTDQVDHILQWGSLRWGPGSRQYYLRTVKVCAQDAPDLSETPTMVGTFSGAKVSGDLSKWDISRVTSLKDMFRAAALNADISAWDTSQVTDMSYALAAYYFNGDVSDWDTSKVTTMDKLFFNSGFNGDLSRWDTSQVTTMDGMFLESPFAGDISQWDISNATNLKLGIASDEYSVENYNAVLIAWAANPNGLKPNVTLSIRAHYSGKDADNARDALIYDHGWTVDDLGPVR
jgi:surface protein